MPDKLKKTSSTQLNARQIKDVLYEQVARIGKATSSPKRLELIELLCQGEMNVDQLASEAQISIKLASAHLSVLKSASMVCTRREGKNIFYKLASTDVANFWVDIRSLAEERLLELQTALGSFVHINAEITQIDRNTLLQEAKNGEVVVIDVRPATEYTTAHLPYARSIPLAELKKRLTELPKDKIIVAYCRGPFCLFATEAVNILQKAGHRAKRLDDGIAEWRSHGFMIEQ